MTIILQQAAKAREVPQELLRRLLASSSVSSDTTRGNDSSSAGIQQSSATATMGLRQHELPRLAARMQKVLGDSAATQPDATPPGACR